jgi:putative intracellular protease/amidase
MATVLIPLPHRDFDPTEVAVPWSILRDAGHEVVLATADGGAAAADPIVLDGVMLGMMGPVPHAARTYAELDASGALQSPARLHELDPERIDGLLLPGGHAPGMRPYLEDEGLFRLAAGIFAANKPVAAICHGVLVMARAHAEGSERSLLRGRTTTCLPRYMERLAWWSTAWKLGRYFRTYDAFVQDEVEAGLGPEGTFVRGPIHLFARGTESDDRPAFVVEDGRYVSARWPGDAYLLGKRLAARLSEADRAHHGA